MDFFALLFKLGNFLMSKTGRGSFLIAIMTIVYTNIIDVISLINAIITTINDLVAPNGTSGHTPLNLNTLSLINYVIPIDLMAIQIYSILAWMLVCGTIRFFKGWIPTMN